MINGKIDTFKTESGGLLYAGTCVVTNESVTAGEVMSAQVPEGPAKGFRRRTLKWEDTRESDGSSRCEFEILDERVR